MSKRPSPDSVTCIDLTVDDDEQESRLGGVRKALHRTPGGRAAKKKKANRARVKAEARSMTPDDDVIEIVESVTPDDDDDVIEIVEPTVKAEGKRAVRASSHSNDDDIEIVEPTETPMVPVARLPSNTSNDDDIEVVGAVNEVRLPHMRQHCTQFKFDPTPAVMLFGKGYRKETLEANYQSCELCYCYACDCLVKECTSWQLASSTDSASNHCCASDADYMWVRRRSAIKDGRASRVPASASRLIGTSSNTNAHSSSHSSTANISTARGPFAPDSTEGRKDDTLTKCRKCGWFSRFWHHTFGGSDDTSSVHCCCHHCGRVASERDFGRNQRIAYKPKADDFYFGKKEIPFRIKAQDPRLSRKYQRNWESADTTSPEWTYSEADLEEDVFLHRLGQRPPVEQIRDCIARVSEDKLPTAGQARRTGGGRMAQNFEAEITGSVILQKEGDIHLFHLLDGRMSYDIAAQWDKANRSGVSVNGLLGCIWLQSKFSI